MKDLGPARKVLGMVIERDRSKSCLKIDQHDYLLKAIKKFDMSDCKSMNVPLAGYFILFKIQCRTSNSEILKMENISYANVIETIMYSIISTRAGLAFSISLLSNLCLILEKLIGML